MSDRRHLLQALGGLACAPLSLALPRAAQASDEAPRLVSIHGSITEIIYQLEAQQLLVGTDTTSTYPAAATRTAKVGYLRQLSAEGLLSLKPSAILGTDEAGPPAVLAQLRQAGVPLKLVDVKHRFEDLLEKVTLAGAATRKQAAAQALAADLQKNWQAVRQRTAQRQGNGPRVLFLMAHGPSPSIAGQDTAAHAMLTYAGARNAMAEINGWRSLNAESAVQARPDWIVTTHESVAMLGGPQKFWQLPGLALTPAGRQQRLLTFDTMALLGFGPRCPTALDELQRALA